MWSLGCIAYILLLGKPPYEGDESTMVQNIMYKEVDIKEKDWIHITPEAQNFVLKCLNRDAASRASVKDLFEEPWIKRWIADPVVQERTALVVTDALISFRKAGILQTGVLSFLTNLLATEEELEELGEMFK